MAGSGTRTSTFLIVFAAIVSIAVVLALASGLPSRMPPDPFEGNEPREIFLEVDWQGRERIVNIEWFVGDDFDQVNTFGTYNGDRWYWNHVTTAEQGTLIHLRGTQAVSGPIRCTVYINDQEFVPDTSDKVPGCFLEILVP